MLIEEDRLEESLLRKLCRQAANLPRALAHSLEDQLCYELGSTGIQVRHRRNPLYQLWREANFELAALGIQTLNPQLPHKRQHRHSFQARLFRPQGITQVLRTEAVGPLRLQRNILSSTLHLGG
jgi:hypothetical protein